MPSITVLVSSPDRARRRSCLDVLAGQPGLRVVGEARTGLQTLAMAGMLKPRVVLLDQALSGEGDRALIPAVRGRHPGVRLLLLTRPEPEPRVLDALSLGARGCLAWDAVPAFLAAAIRALDAGEAWVPRKMVLW